MRYYALRTDIRDSERRKKVTDMLIGLKTDLAAKVPAKTLNENLLVATWNIRDFGSNKFGHGHRLPESYFYIAEVLSSFDVIAVQEVSDNLTTFQKLMYIMGENWDYILTDVTEGSSGNGERMAYIFDKRRVLFKKIAGEIVLPKNKLVSENQFARTPYLVAFQAGWFKFQLCTVHIYFGSDTGAALQRRIDEIAAIAKFFSDRAKQQEENIILLGDFNIVSPKHETMQALENNKFIIPEQIKTKPIPTNKLKTKHYDQIAYREKEGEVLFADSPNSAGAYDYYEKVYTPAQFEHFRQDILAIVNNKIDACKEELAKAATAKKKAAINKELDGLKKTIATKASLKEYYEKTWCTFQMSDHLPMWVELKINFSMNYLNKLKEEAGVVE